MKDIQQELRGAFNTTAYSKRVLDKSAADMVSDFERRLLRIVANIDSQFEVGFFNILLLSLFN